MHTQGNPEVFAVVVMADQYSILEGQVQMALRTLAAVSFAGREQEEEEEMIEALLLTSLSILELRSQI